MAETLIFSTGSRVISGTLSSTASISQLNLDGVSGSFTGTFIGEGAELTGVVSVSHAANADTAVLAVSAVTALTSSHVAGGNVFGAVGLADTASFLLGSVESASFATFATTAASASDVAYNDVRDKPALISSSAQFDGNDSFTMDNLIVSGFLQVNGNTLLVGITDMDGDLEIRVGSGMRIGHSSFIQGPDPTSIPQSSSLHELQMIGGNSVPPNSMMIAQFSNTGSNGPFMIFGKSGGTPIGSFSRPFPTGNNLGGLLWAIADGFSGDIRVHAASIKAEVDGVSFLEGFAGASLVFSVGQNVSANDITEAMRIRADLTLVLTGSLAHAGPNLGFYSTSPIAQQTGVAVTDAAIHAALVALGLITA